MAITAIKRYSAGRGYRWTDPIYNYLTSDQIIKLSKIKRISDSRQTALGLNKSLRISTKPTPQKSAIISNPQPPLTGKFKRPPSQTALSLNKSLKQGVMGKFKRPKGQTGIGWSGQSSISKTTKTPVPPKTTPSIHVPSDQGIKKQHIPVSASKVPPITQDLSFLRVPIRPLRDSRQSSSLDKSLLGDSRQSSSLDKSLLTRPTPRKPMSVPMKPLPQDVGLSIRSVIYVPPNSSKKRRLKPYAGFGME